MRPYDREDFRHLTDSERYRDIDYLADDGYVGPNERIAYGMTRDDLPPWSTMGDGDTRAFAGQRSWDEDRGQGRQYGQDMGLGYGRPYDATEIERSRQDPYERRADLQADRPHPLRAAYDRRGDWHGHGYGVQSEREMQGQREMRGREEGGIGEYLRHPGRIVDAAKGLFRGKGPKNWSRSDTRIHDEVCERLALNPEIDASEIEVNVKDGEVTLSGGIEDRRLRWLAEDIAGDVLGVHDVHNRLRLRPGAREEQNPLQGYGTQSMQRSGSTGTGAVSSSGGVRR